ncbi:MAG: F0F1 ATP synthase subunit B family protein [Bdellovibrionota bacterium]
MEHLIAEILTLKAPFFNFFCLVAILVWKLRKPLGDFVHSRHLLLRDELMHVREQLRIAQDKYDEFSAKLKAIDAEISSLREQSKRDAQAARQRVSAEARKLAATIVSDARESAQALFEELRGQLFSELGTRILTRAEALLRERLTGDDRARIRQEFSRQLESVQ